MNQDTGDAVFINSPITTLNSSEITVESKKDTVAQRLVIQLKSFLGDWFLDTSYGIPYLQEILGRKGVRKSYIDGIMRREILKESGVKGIIDFESTLSPSRVYSLVFRVKVSDNTVSDIIKIDKVI